MRILIVEDNPSTGDAMKTVMQLKGHHVMLARNPDEAKMILKTGRVDVAVIDWWLEPGEAGNGADVVREARAAGIDTPCIVFTGMTDTSVKDSIMSDVTALGNVEFLTKPIDPDALLMSMKVMLQGRTLMGSREGVPDSWMDR